MRESAQRDWFFNCNQCGRCCTTGPAMSIEEAFALQDVFIVGIKYQVNFISNNPSILGL